MRSRTHELLAGRCPRCYAAEKWCLCSKIPTIQTSFQLVILRHLRESYKTSNTARMAHLALPNSAIIDYLPETFHDASINTEDSALLFPTTEANWPEGQTPTFTLAWTRRESDGSVSCASIKDGGDDPDVTHKAELRANVRLNGQAGTVNFLQGEGVGKVTLPGLGLEVGGPAINPVPRQMMTRHALERPA